VAAPAQILIVEDKDSLRTMLRHALERQGHSVLEARDQPEAVRMLQQSPAIVLSDLRLPEGDGFGVLRASKEFDADTPVIVTLQRDGAAVERLFDPYAARDLGLAYPPITDAIEWVVDLHDNLLTGTTGRAVNGVGALLFLALVITGAIVWWPGVGRLGHSMVPGKPAKSARFARRLHNALGIWALALILMWAITAVYFSFPDPFEWTMDYFDDDLSDAKRPGDGFVRELVNLHFGRSWGMPGKLAWVALGLVPAVLFVTGCITWWRRRVTFSVDPES
jgi:uncharacterized iron-regulated membrane protein